MTSVVPGLIKIGKTTRDNFESRMRFLEKNGYNNVVGLQRQFAIEVEDYDEKEDLMHTIFEKIKLKDSELFALDINMVIQLFASLEGEQIFPEDETKEETFDLATQNYQESVDISRKIVPDGFYYLKAKVKNFGMVDGKMKVDNGKFIVLKGSVCAPISYNGYPKQAQKRQSQILNNRLTEDYECNSPSLAGFIVKGKSTNGWMEWKTVDGEPITVFRNK